MNWRRSGAVAAACCALLLGGNTSAAAPASTVADRPAALVLIRGATVHTQTAAGVLADADILIRDGRIAALGSHLEVTGGPQVIDAHGRPVTPGLFGGVSHLGLEEIGLESSVDDYSVKLGMRPEFDVTSAFNPDSVVLGVGRLGGVTFAQLAPSAAGGAGAAGGSLIAGQGAMARLDGSVSATRALFVEAGGGASEFSGGSRAGQLMLLQQAFAEARDARTLQAGDLRLLTPLGRKALAGYLGGQRIVIAVDRTSDIREVIDLARRERLKVAIRGGTEAWRLADDLAAARIPVLLDPLADLPGNFDSVGATLENAARLQRAGVVIAFSFAAPEPHNIRTLRQGAGVAVAHGLPPEAALAALTRNPAEIFGVADRNGSIEPGRPADLVLWSGDPLEVTTLADEVFIQGTRQNMHSRQTELRDRYLPALRAHLAK